MKAFMSKLRSMALCVLAVAASSVMATDKAANNMSATQQLARAAQPWLPSNASDNDSNRAMASAASKLACLRSETLPVPQSDLPLTSDLPALAACNSEASYYGDNGSTDMVRARKCAYLERANGDKDPVAGSAVLTMIYANGMGVPRNLPLATKFACEAGGAAAEIDGRIEHLQQLASKPSPGRFDICDDITSGFMQGFCTRISADQANGRRADMLALLTRSYDYTQKQAWAVLRKAADAYFHAHAESEVDLSGTGRAAYEIADQQYNEKIFLDNLKTLETGKLKAVDAKQADARLNAVYRRVMADPQLQPANDGTTAFGTITAKGVRVDQRLWLAYRDAWLRFAAARKPALSPDKVSAWITTQRIDDLRGLLPSKDPDYRAGDN
jgi:uncharacterized protein YecT (DUF1311 family)